MVFGEALVKNVPRLNSSSVRLNQAHPFLLNPYSLDGEQGRVDVTSPIS